MTEGVKIPFIRTVLEFGHCDQPIVSFKDDLSPISDEARQIYLHSLPVATCPWTEWSPPEIKLKKH